MLLRLSFMALFYFFAIPLFAQKNARLINSGEIIKTGVALYDDSKYKEALVEFDKVPPGDTNYVLALYESALTCAADSQFARGIDYCQRAFSTGKERFRHPEFLSQYATLLDYAEQKERSLKVFDSAIAVYPAFINLYINKGTTLIRLERYAEAEAVFQQALAVNPYSSAAHFKLGVAAWSQGKIIPSFMSMIACLTIDPEGNYARNAISVLSEISKSTDEVVQMVENRKEENSGNFKLIEQIVLSKIALDKNYKSKIDLDDPISRQIQVAFEKMSFDEEEKDFYMQVYVPLYKKIFEGGKFEHFINYIFSIADIPSIKEFNKKKKKEIDALKNDISEYLEQIRGSREIQFAKRGAVKERYEYSNGSLFGKGKIEAKDRLTGPWTFYFAPGNKKGEGSFNDKGEKHGQFTFYYFDGTLRTKEFYQNGKQEGQEFFYHDNGIVSAKGAYKNGLEEGEHSTYYTEGAIKSVQQYSNGKLNGLTKNYYKTGALQSEELYKEGKRNGPYKTYFETGALNSEEVYVEDKLNGPFKSWYKDGALAIEANYVQGELSGPLKRYHQNGKPSMIENYSKGILEGETVAHHDNGQLYYRYMNNKGKSTGDIQYFDRDGKQYAVLSFEKDALKSARYFDKSGKQISASEAKPNGLSLDAYNADGARQSLSPFTPKGDLEGTKIYFYPSGRESLKETYVKSVLNGETVAYHPNGAKKYAVEYNEGEKNGYYTQYFIHGQIEEEGWYAADQQQGEYLVYDEMGTIIIRANLLNGVLNGSRIEYWASGKKKADNIYEMGKIKTRIEFDTAGNVIHISSLNNGNGKFTSKYPNGKLYSECTYVNGNIDGAYKFYYPDGKLYSVKYFKNGLADSIGSTYGFDGKLLSDYKFRLNDKTGTWKHHYKSGQLYYTEDYKDDELHGKSIYYYKNGKVDTYIEHQNGEKHGTYKRFAPDGTLMFQIRYEHGKRMGYTYTGKDGQLVEEIPFPRGNGKLNAFYANGKPSASMEYIDDVLHGDHTFYYPNGQLFSIDKQVYGATNGVRNEFYADGKPESVFNYKYDNCHGPYKLYNQQGVVVESGDYYNDELHGEQRIYDEQGKLKQVRVYYYGTLLEVK